MRLDLNRLNCKQKDALQWVRDAFKTEIKTKVETVTAITAICEFFGITHVTFADGTVNDQSFRVFLLSPMEKLQIFDKSSCVFVMDNVGLHKSKKVTDLISSKNYEVLNTAPNSCELNPIEFVFGIWKSRLSIPTTVRSSEQPIIHLYKSLVNITRTEVASCINMVKCHYLPLTQQGKDLREVFNFQRLDDGEIRIEDITDELEDNQIVPCSSASASASSAISPCNVHHNFEQVNAHFSSHKDPELPSSVIEVPDSNKSQETIHENEKNNDMDVD
ncbi:putative DDE superfamily endonuclease [Monocercomonoides exilis]|uniref:putative DDE superfamily endonuclease n=1 Tax=Monocercomonoides exilis TaxID=2049356 RepID=UPI003559404A|nr:putative DDE superfamily endonuclease [Monocercomonoides exilis]|eukprot:MONOS_13489.1-p1 / transcript=MONOS_13489.1 / gene=MONOS_13489 / organism=Monocercomonoides_exilis_PA203 / gene_product=unspecified product / transcript_product=unspecified product / location=Mono_scaffold00836:3212-4036(+) / protein_length=274 / sequence_SO=supercontig / SO=protein_coding / is_pseudo=false